MANIEDLSYTDILALGALMHHTDISSAGAPTLEISNIGGRYEKIYPNISRLIEMVDSLKNKGALEMFSFYEPTGGRLEGQYYPLQDLFDIDIEDLDLHFEDLLHGEFLSGEAQCFDIWVQLAKDEVGYHLRNEMLRLFNHDFNFGKKTEALISRLVANMPQSKIYSLIYSAGNAALRFQKENHAGRPHVCNYMINLMDKNLDKFISKEWNYKDSWRSVPQSKFSEIFFNKVLKIGDAGFTTIPNKNIL